MCRSALFSFHTKDRRRLSTHNISHFRDKSFPEVHRTGTYNRTRDEQEKIHRTFVTNSGCRRHVTVDWTPPGHCLLDVIIIIIFVYYRQHMRGRSWKSYFCLSVRPSVRPSVTRMDCDKTKWRTAHIFILRERAITLLLWYQAWLVGDAPFPLKSAFKVIHPPSKNVDFDRFPLITSQL